MPKIAPIQIHIISDRQENIDILVSFLKADYPEISSALLMWPFTKSDSVFTADIILLDVSESKERQLKLCQQLRDGKITSHPSIMILSSRNSDTDILDAFAVGAADYVLKPYKLTILKARIEAQLQLLTAQQMADSANLAKSRLLANMSHDIRTPMAGIIGMAQLALETDLDEKQHKLLSNIQYSAETLVDLLNDILDFSKNEAGQLTLHHENFNLPLMLDKLLTSLYFLATKKQIQLENHSDYTALPVFIKTDELRLRQILTNLIGNAIKFTENGQVVVTVEEKSRDQDTITLLFSISDTGIGISLDKQTRIFNMFSQAEASTYGEYGGSGLGLTICRQLVELMDGKIQVESEPGRGSTFSFTINVLAGQQTLRPVKNNEKVENLRNLTILLVEDNKFNQDIATAILEKDDHTVTVADNGLQSLQMIANNNYDIVIMDLQMPVMSGLTATAIIRACERDDYTGRDIDTALHNKLVTRLRRKHLPIIAMTANVMDEDRQKSFTAGMDDYLTKPFMPADMQKAFINLL